jgi:ArsR family transcriptional regulator, lead/cadmium/zinc/bismuth-responsive transcriptional repressor
MAATRPYVGEDPAAIARARRLLTNNRAVVPRMAELYKLLANDTRLRLLLVLSEIDRMCVSDLATVVGLSIAATSHQLKALRDRGWLDTRSDGRLVYYSLSSADLRDALVGDLRLIKNQRG